MYTKEFFRTIYNRYTCTGLCVMGICNIVLLLLYLKRWIGALPANTTLFAIDAALVLGITLLGLVVETVRAAAGKKNRGAGKTHTGNQEP